jgi:hypothetical protein
MDDDANDAALAQLQLEERERFEIEQALLRSDLSFTLWLEYFDRVLDVTVGRAMP